MKTLKYLFLSLALVAVAFAQGPPSPNVTFNAGPGSTSTRPCNDSAYVGSIWTQVVNGGVTSVCQQTGANSLGQGAYGWVNSFVASVTGGTLTIASGKAPVINESITFAGTDATTMTFPSTSATIARTDAANTFTGVQTFSSKPTFSTGTILANANTVTFPAADITVPGTVGTFCGTTTTCAATNISTTMKVVSGQVALTSGTPSTAVVASIPAFTSTTSYACSVTDMTSATNNLLKVVNTSSSSITITGPNTLTDTIGYVCFGS